MGSRCRQFLRIRKITGLARSSRLLGQRMEKNCQRANRQSKTYDKLLSKCLLKHPPLQCPERFTPLGIQNIEDGTRLEKYLCKFSGILPVFTFSKSSLMCSLVINATLSLATASLSVRGIFSPERVVQTEGII